MWDDSGLPELLPGRLILRYKLVSFLCYIGIGYKTYLKDVIRKIFFKVGFYKFTRRFPQTVQFANPSRCLLASSRPGINRNLRYINLFLAKGFREALHLP